MLPELSSLGRPVPQRALPCGLRPRGRRRLFDLYYLGSPALQRCWGSKHEGRSCKAALNHCGGLGFFCFVFKAGQINVLRRHIKVVAAFSRELSG